MLQTFVGHAFVLLSTLLDISKHLCLKCQKLQFLKWPLEACSNIPIDSQIKMFFSGSSCICQVSNRATCLIWHRLYTNSIILLLKDRFVGSEPELTKRPMIPGDCVCICFQNQTSGSSCVRQLFSNYITMPLTWKFPNKEHQSNVHCRHRWSSTDRKVGRSIRGCSSL